MEIARYSNQANSDLRGVYEHIAFELLSPDNAARQLDRLEEHIMRLENFPEKFRAYKKEHVDDQLINHTV